MRTGEPVAGAFVKVSAGNSLIGEGRTDARGVFNVTGDFGEFAVRPAAVAGKDGEAHFPGVFGHESSGTVESIGPGVTTVNSQSAL